MRAKAAELGIELPPVQLPLAPAAGTPGPTPALGEGRRVTAAHAGKGGRVAAVAPPLARPLRRASCPDGGPDGPAPEQHPPARRVTVQERRKPPLPPAAVPQRRRTVQAGAVAERAPSPPKQPRGAAAAAGPAPVQQLANSLEDAHEPLVQAPPAAAAAATGLIAAPAQPGQVGGSPGAAKPAALKVTHFSVQRHLSSMGSAAREWLQQRNGSGSGSGSGSGAADGVVELEVQRSAKSDSTLLALGAHRAAVAAVHCPVVDATEGSAADEAANPAAQLRQRCAALLGSEERCAQLLALAKAAAAAEQGGGGGSDGGGNSGPSMASLGEAVYAVTGNAGRAGETMFLLMRLLAAEG